MQENRIIIGADLAPIDNDGALFSKKQPEMVVDSRLIEQLNKAAFTIFNLEAPLINGGEPIEKDGPNICLKEESVNSFDALHLNLLTLANNHIMDYGDKGLDKTLQILKEHKIDIVGVGNNVTEAAEPYFTNIGGKRIGVYACADYEFSIATKDRKGVNPFDCLDSPKHIERAKEQCDFLIVLYHGGRELYQFPTPNLQKMCHGMVDAGADLVVCQHSHCIGAEEEYKESKIVYGQGNFVFGEAEADVCVESLLITLSLSDPKAISYIPISRIPGKVMMQTGKEQERILKEFKERSIKIQKDGFVEEEFDEQAKQRCTSYLYQLAGWPLILIRFDKLTGRKLIKGYFKRKRKRSLVIQNMIQCNAHREVILSGMRQLLNED